MAVAASWGAPGGGGGSWGPAGGLFEKLSPRNSQNCRKIDDLRLRWCTKT